MGKLLEKKKLITALLLWYFALCLFIVLVLKFIGLKEAMTFQFEDWKMTCCIAPFLIANINLSYRMCKFLQGK